MPSIEVLVEAYVTWLRNLQAGKAPLTPQFDDDLLAPLGREVERLLAAVTRREKELLQLIDLVHTAYKGGQLDDVLERIFEGFRGVIPFDRIGCAFLTDDRQQLV